MILKRIFQILAIFVLGVLGGMLWQAICLPYLAQNPTFGKFWFIKEFKSRETVIFQKEEVHIQENAALSKAVEKVESLVVGIKTQPKKGKLLEGSGLVLTTDGMIVTLAELMPDGSTSTLFINDQVIPFEMKKKDVKANLVLLKIERQKLPTCGFADLEKLQKGQKIFLVGAIFLNNKLQRIVNEGIVRLYDGDSILTNISEKKTFAGSPVFDIEGNALGISTIDLEEKVSAIPISQIRKFAGL